jgi:hypothetical protein
MIAGQQNPAQSSDDQLEEYERLVRSFRRDLSAWILEVSGLRETTNAPYRRILRTWDRICEIGMPGACSIAAALTGLAGELERYGDPDGPAETRGRAQDELIGLMKIGRAANPNAEVETFGDLVRLGEQEIQRQVDADTQAGGGEASL